MALRSEKDLEDFLYELFTKNPYELKKYGLDNIITTKRWFRQYNIGGWYMDLLGSLRKANKELHFQIVELKNRPLVIDDVDQIVRYETMLLGALHDCEMNLCQIDLILIGENAIGLTNHFLLSRISNLILYTFYLSNGSLSFENVTNKHIIKTLDVGYEYKIIQKKIFKSDKVEDVTIEKIASMKRTIDRRTSHKELFWLDDYLK